jgi:pimeloyl-ACP methyl ester carboxylesterase
VLGVVNIDNPIDIRPFAQLVRRLAPALNSPRFAAAFEPFQQSTGLDLVAEPLRSHVLAIQDARPELVLGYWDQVIRSDPDELQAWIEETLHRIDAPYLGIFGRTLEPGERDYTIQQITDLQLEEWPGSGHFVQLSNLERFTARLQDFIRHCLTQ